jgi:glycosyltransferase involved in cell wall biosynthesis
VHVLNDVDKGGNGIVHAVVDLACEQSARGDAVFVASSGGAFEPLLSERGVHHVAVPGIRRLAGLVSSARGLRQLILEQQIEVVHAHMNFSTLVARAAVTRTRARLVASAHTAFKWEAACMGAAELVITFGQAGVSAMRARGVGRSRLRIVCNGIVGSARAVRGEDVELARPAVVSVAGMYPRKGIDVLIRAFQRAAARHPEAHLHLVGDGPMRQLYEEQARQAGLSDRIHFHGFREDVEAVLRAADVFVLASRRDPFPLVVLEAREAGCAVVATAVDGVPEACDWGRAGVLVPAEDDAALATALSMLLDDEATLERWQRAAEHNLEKFTVAQMTSDVAEVYQELLDRRRRRGACASRGGAAT